MKYLDKMNNSESYKDTESSSQLYFSTINNLNEYSPVASNMYLIGIQNHILFYRSPYRPLCSLHKMKQRLYSLSEKSIQFEHKDNTVK